VGQNAARPFVRVAAARQGAADITKDHRRSALMLLRNLPGHGPADFFKARKIPAVGKVAALLRLDGLHGAIAAMQENAFAAGFVLQRKTAPILAQSCVMLNEIEFVQPEKFCEARDFVVSQLHLPRPAAALRAADAFVMNGHERKVAGRARP